MTMSTTSGPSKRKARLQIVARVVWGACRSRAACGALPARCWGCRRGAGAPGDNQKFVARALNGPARHRLPVLPRSSHVARRRMQVARRGGALPRRRRPSLPPTAVVPPARLSASLTPTALPTAGRLGADGRGAAGGQGQAAGGEEPGAGYRRRRLCGLPPLRLFGGTRRPCGCWPCLLFVVLFAVRAVCCSQLEAVRCQVLHGSCAAQPSGTAGGGVRSRLALRWAAVGPAAWFTSSHCARWA